MQIKRQAMVIRVDLEYTAHRATSRSRTRSAIRSRSDPDRSGQTQPARWSDLAPRVVTGDGARIPPAFGPVRPRRVMTGGRGGTAC